MNPNSVPIVVCSAVLLITAACTWEDEHSNTIGPAAMHTVAGVDDFRIGTESLDDATVTSVKHEFAAGEAIHVSMAVDAMARGRSVTTYWYGPEEWPLAYETKIVKPDQDRLRFMQDDTRNWAAGEYRAEIWIGGRKVGEQQFEIAASG